MSDSKIVGLQANKPPGNQFTDRPPVLRYINLPSTPSKILSESVNTLGWSFDEQFEPHYEFGNAGTLAISSTQA